MKLNTILVVCTASLTTSILQVSNKFKGILINFRLYLDYSDEFQTIFMATQYTQAPQQAGQAQQGVSGQPTYSGQVTFPQGGAQQIRYQGAIPGQAQQIGQLGYPAPSTGGLPAGATLAGGYQASAPRVISGPQAGGYVAAGGQQLGGYVTATGGQPAGGYVAAGAQQYYEGSPQVVRVGGQETSPMTAGQVRRVAGPTGGVYGQPISGGIEGLGQPTGVPGQYIDAQGRTIRRLDAPPPGYSAGAPQLGYPEGVRRIEAPQGQVYAGVYPSTAIPAGAQVIQQGGQISGGQVIQGGYYQPGGTIPSGNIPAGARIISGGQLPAGYSQGTNYGQPLPAGVQYQQGGIGLTGAPGARTGQFQQAGPTRVVQAPAPPKEEDSTPLC